MVITVFRSRLRPENAERYHAVAERIDALAAEADGLLEWKSFVADDGERVTIAVFDSLESQHAWRDHPEHLAAQREGREAFYAEYRVDVCELRYSKEFPRAIPEG